MSHKWTGVGSLTRVGKTDVQPGESFEATESELASFSDDIEVVADDETPGLEPEETTEDGGYSESELEDMEYSELREMAVEADTDEINGRSSKDEIVGYFAG